MPWSVAAGYRSADPTSTLLAVLPAGREQRKHHRYLPAEELREALAEVDSSGVDWETTQRAAVPCSGPLRLSTAMAVGKPTGKEPLSAPAPP